MAIKSIQDVLTQIIGYRYLNENESEIQKEDIEELRKWSNEIIDELRDKLANQLVVQNDYEDLDRIVDSIKRKIK